MSVLVQQSGLRQILQTKIGTSPKTGGLTSLVSICKIAMTNLHQSRDEEQKQNIILLVQHIIELKIEILDDVIDDVMMMSSFCTSTKLEYLFTLMTSSLTMKKPISDWSKIERISMAVFLANENEDTPTQSSRNATMFFDPSYLKILPKLIQHSDWIKRKLMATAEGSPELVQNLLNVAIQSSHWSEINFAIQLANQNEHLNSEIIISILESRNLAAIKHVIKIIEKSEKWHDLIGQIISRKRALNPVISKLQKIIRQGSHWLKLSPSCFAKIIAGFSLQFFFFQLFWKDIANFNLLELDTLIMPTNPCDFLSFYIIGIFEVSTSGS